MKRALIIAILFLLVAVPIGWVGAVHAKAKQLEEAHAAGAKAEGHT